MKPGGVKFKGMAFHARKKLTASPETVSKMCIRDRARFEREFDRAAEAGIRIYLLVEGGTWEKVYNGKYRSLFAPQALVASIDAFRARYGLSLIHILCLYVHGRLEVPGMIYRLMFFPQTFDS